MAENQIFTTSSAKKLTPLVVQGCLYNIALYPFVHTGFSKRYVKKQVLGLLCTIVVQYYSGFLAVVVKQQVFLTYWDKKDPEGF